MNSHKKVEPVENLFLDGRMKLHYNILQNYKEITG